METSVRAGKPKHFVSAASVARAAGVSAATVSYVMNGKTGVSPETRRHVISVANDLGFRPRSSGPGLSPQRTRVIGLIVPNILNPMYTRWAQGVISTAADSGYEVFTAITQDDADTLGQITATLAARNVDGVIIAAALREDATALRTLRTARIPFVYLSRKSTYLEGDYVGIDDSGAASLIMKHMLAHGYQDIATVIGPRFSSASLAREQGLVRAAAEAGISIPGEWKISTKLNNAGGRAAAKRLLASRRRPRAILCGSDEIAIGIMEYALSQGLRIPEDIAVTGSDGLPHSISGLINLTTIVQPQQEMAHEAFAMLLKRMENPSPQYQSMICAYRLHIGRTCGCDPATA